MNTTTQTDTRTYRGWFVTADEAVTAGVNQAGRDGFDVFDVASVRRSPDQRTKPRFIDGEFVTAREFIVKIRTIR